MASDLVCDACGVARERQSLVTMLRASRFIRSSGSSERIETYHDRIRDVAGRGRSLPTPCGGSTAAMVQVLVATGEATIARRCSSTTAARATRRTRRFKPASPAKGGRRARLRSRRVLLPACAGAVAGVAARASVERRARDALANAGRPADAAEAYLRAAEGAGDLRARRAPATRRRTVPDRRAHRSRPGADSTRAGEHGHECAAEPARGVAAAVVAARSASVARLPLRADGRRAHRRRYPAAAWTPAGRRHRTGPRGHDRRGRRSAPVTCSGARCRRTVPPRPRDGHRVGRPKRGIRDRTIARAGSSSSREHSRRASGARTRSRSRSWRTG